MINMNFILLNCQFNCQLKRKESNIEMFTLVEKTTSILLLYQELNLITMHSVQYSSVYSCYYKGLQEYIKHMKTNYIMFYCLKSP